MSIFRAFLTFFLFFFSQRIFSEELIQAPAAIQISSQVSDGKYTIPQILEICRDQQIKIVVIADRDLMRWEYGIWPWRNIFKKTVEDGSILKYGAKRYLNEFKEIQKNNPDLVVIPGTESAPFYYWSGDLFHSNLEIRDWHKHIIAIGLENARDFEHLPVIGNKVGLALPFSVKNLILFWPVLLLAVGIFCFQKKVFDYKDDLGHQLGQPSKSSRKLGVLLLVIAGVFLLNNFPFVYYCFDQYNQKAGIKPYQNYIDYVNKHNGLTFWAHPEAKNVEKSGEVSIRTEEHPLDLLLSRDYTGFAVFPEGFKTVGKIDGIWDSLLKDYCAGNRKKPVWAIGVLSFDSTGKLEEYLKVIQTVLLLPVLNQQEALKAIASGKMYASQGRNPAQFVLSRFSVANESTGVEKIMGEQLEIRGIPIVKIKADFLNGQPQPFKIKLIRNGKVIKMFESFSSGEITYVDEQSPEAGIFYYRLEIHGPDVLVVTNPIFVKKVK